MNSNSAYVRISGSVRRNYCNLSLMVLLLFGLQELKAQCILHSILSTGFNRATQTPYPANGGIDPYWEVVKRQDLDNNYDPLPGTDVVFQPPNPVYVIVPYGSSPTIGTARHINVTSTYHSQYQTKNMVTYRTYFTLPSPLPSNITYSLSFSIAADDGVYQVSLNGVDLKAPTFFNNSGGAYNPFNPLNLSVSSFNTSNAFLPGSNYIDITVGDLGLVAFFMEAEILLYTCTIPDPKPKCSDCISSFAPIPGKKYLIDAWAKERNAAQSKTDYTFPSIDVQFPSVSGSVGPFTPGGSIIDGWQKIVGEFVVPSNATDISIKLNCSGGNGCYFDDVRVLPFDGSMKSYVYDPVNLRLVAELDERNYATLYEYDEEGKLIRVKKETERGKMTIRENRDNTRKQ